MTDISTIGTSWKTILNAETFEQATQAFASETPRDFSFPGALCEAGIAPETTAISPWTGLILDPPFFYNAKFNEDKNDFPRIPFWLTPRRKFEGKAWFAKEMSLPSGAACYMLEFERVHWFSELWVNGERIGSCDSLSAPHRYCFRASGPVRILLAIDNRYRLPVGISAHSVSDHTQGNWNGAVGRITMTEVPPVAIDSFRIDPVVRQGKLSAEICLQQVVTHEKGATLDLALENADGQILGTRQFEISDFGTKLRLEMPAPPDIRYWDEFEPVLYRMCASLCVGGVSQHFVRTTGFRTWESNGTQFALNGRKVYLRGTLECAVFPKTGYPPTDVSEWERIMKRLKSFGLNHIRFHSWCPPDAAFEAGDRHGVFLQPELPMWCRSFGCDPRIEPFMEREARAIFQNYGSHPSFVMFCLGNEPGTGGDDGDYSDSGAAIRDPVLCRIMKSLREEFPGYPISAGAGWPDLDESDFILTFRPRCYRWAEGSESRFEHAAFHSEGIDYTEEVAMFPQQPMIAHESGEWCAFPDFEEIEKYTGNLQPRNLERCRERLEANNLGSMAKELHLASGTFQSILYREEIETAQRTPGMAGYQILGLTDFPGQGTALVGLLDSFWDEKAYISANVHSSYCGPSVILPTFEGLVYEPGQQVKVGLVVHHYGPSDLSPGTLDWRLENASGKTAAKGEVSFDRLPTGGIYDIGSIGFDAPSDFGEWILHCCMDGAPAMERRLWVLNHIPRLSLNERRLDLQQQGISIVDKLDDSHGDLLAGGATILHLPAAHSVPGDDEGFVRPFFTNIFWNSSWTRRRHGKTLGAWIDSLHGVFKGFPTRRHSDWHWWELLKTMQPASIGQLHPELKPMMLAIDDYHTGRKLALIFEARVGKGRYLFCGMDLFEGPGSGLVRRTLANSIFHYLVTEDFDPCVTVDFRALCQKVSL